MKIIFITCALITSSMANAEWDTYTTGDLLNFLDFHSKNETLMHEYKNCTEIPFLKEDACNNALIKINSELVSIKPYIQGGTFAYHESIPTIKIKKDTDLRYGDLSLQIGNNSGFYISQKGLSIGHADYPNLAKFELSLVAKGDGIIRKHNVDIFGTDLDTKLKIGGSVDVTVVAAFALNPKVLETENSLKLIFEPKFRLIPTKSSHNLTFDVSSNWWNSILNFVQAAGNLGQLVIDLGSDWNAIEDDLEDFGISFGEFFLSLFISADDLLEELAGDGLFDFASELTSIIIDHRLDSETKRVLFNEEERINSIIANRLGLDENGLLVKEYNLSEVKGLAVAKILPAIQIILN